MWVKCVLVWYSQPLTSIFGLVNSSIKKMRLECCLHPSHSMVTDLICWGGLMQKNIYKPKPNLKLSCVLWLNEIILKLKPVLAQMEFLLEHDYSGSNSEECCKFWQFSSDQASLWRIYVLHYWTQVIFPIFLPAKIKTC